MEKSLPSTTTLEETFDDSIDNKQDTASIASNSQFSDIITCESNDEYNRHLQTRILLLRDTIQILKRQLHEEREIWKREMEERRENDYINRAAEMGYYYTDANSSPFNSVMNMSSNGGLDSEIMSKYSDTMLQNHYENRQNLQKQIAMANYKRRLLEVENMCNLELLRVKQSVQILQPLQVMCSEWKFPGEGGDIGIKSEVTDTDEEKLKNRPTEVAMPLEMIAQRVDDDRNLLMSETAPLEMCRSQPNLSDYSDRQWILMLFTDKFAHTFK